MTLPKADILALRQKAQKIKPIILIGQHGLTTAVHGAIAQGLFDHELLKVRAAGLTKVDFTALAQSIATYHQAELIQLIGRMIVLYKKRPAQSSE